MNKKVTAILSLMFLFIFSPVFAEMTVIAETIVLKSGKTLKADIFEVTDNAIKINVDNAPVTYYFSDIESIDGNSNINPSLLKKEVANKRKPILYLKEILKGNDNQLHRNYEQAIKNYKAAIEIDPDRSDGHQFLANTYYAIARSLPARVRSSKNLKNFPEDFLLSNINKSIEEAGKVLQMERNKGNPYTIATANATLSSCYGTLGNYYNQKRDYVKSKEYLALREKYLNNTEEFMDEGFKKYPIVTQAPSLEKIIYSKQNLPLPEDKLMAESDTVISGEIINSEKIGTAPHHVEISYVTIKIGKTIKGTVSGPTLIVELAKFAFPDGVGVKTPGYEVLIGKSVKAYLKKLQDGNYSLIAFEE